MTIEEAFKHCREVGLPHYKLSLHADGGKISSLIERPCSRHWFTVRILWSLIFSPIQRLVVLVRLPSGSSSPTPSTQGR